MPLQPLENILWCPRSIIGLVRDPLCEKNHKVTKGATIEKFVSTVLTVTPKGMSDVTGVHISPSYLRALFILDPLLPS
ncbi:unnamed protein product [Caretta caretta]